MPKEEPQENKSILTVGSNEKWDTIIIGSGAGGLASAICLSRAGQKVLVLEQHDVPGGWCHSFYLNGHRFTPGVHYVGLLGQGEATNDLYRGLGIANDLVFFKMNSNAYEQVRIGEERFDFPSDLDELIARLSARFPKEKKGISKYLNLVRLVSEEIFSLPYLTGFWQKVFTPYLTRHMGKYGLFSLRMVINWHIKDPLLRNILNIQCGDHGLQPRKAPFPLHCALMSHYFDGGYYPMGGGGALIKAMTNAIKGYDGEIWTQKSVKRILLDGKKRKRAIGVELENGEQLFADQIISNADVGITYNDLVGNENLSKKLNKKLAKTKYSCTSLMLFLTVDMDVRKAGLNSGNIWMMPDMDADEFYDRAMSNDIVNYDAIEGMFISCTTMKDPVSFDGKNHTIEAITYINYSVFDRFKEEEGQRSKAYLDFKEQMMQKMLKCIERALPGISNHIVHKELGTPITNDHYINTTKGNVYGTEKGIKQIGPFAYKAKSEIENLYLCGASILSHGVAGASHSGVNTAALILGCLPLELKEPEDSQHLRIYDAEDSSEYPDLILKKIQAKKNRLVAKEKNKTLL